MDPPQFLLDVLTDSITSGTFIDTKLYVFSRREASGRVGSPRALYCNSRVLNTVPYLSACGYQKLVRRCTSNRTDRKCSQTGFLKDKRGTSTGDSPPIPTLILMTTIIYPTAILKTCPLFLKRKMRNLPKMTAPNSQAVLEVLSLEYRLPHSSKTHHGHHRTLPTFKTTTSQPQCSLNRPTFLANS